MNGRDKDTWGRRQIGQMNRTPWIQPKRVNQLGMLHVLVDLPEKF